MALTAMLPPWTYGLAQLNTAAWFPAPWVQQAWVAFDVALFVALLAALRWPTARLLGALAIVVAGDAAVTLAEAILYPGPTNAMGWAMHVAGVLAPALSATVLAGAHRRTRSNGVRPLQNFVTN